ncbi:NB-ARC domain-containing protein [Humibacillus xanthopallidus]|uniref:NB-ARC domain-containing protein n=1 Tax=Humibacillus xanthopallidus TaxID=412689 RepID=UPI001150BB07|nr:NB-ARC domain-containing protein [Humibacillus xanthopallidus]
MSFSAARLTCFALLSALEEDLRAEIEAVAPDLDIVESFGPDRAEQIRRRRARDHGRPQSDSLVTLLPYLDFADAFTILNKQYNKLSESLKVLLDELKPYNGQLFAARNRVAHSRPMEIDDLPNVIDATRALIHKRGDHFPSLTATHDRIAQDPSHVLALTVDLIADPDRAPQNNLPVPDFDETGFFGRRAQVDRVKKAVKGAYPVVSILGDGGLGKTALALKVAYELLDDHKQSFDAFVWVTAKATVLTVNEIRRINDAVQDSLGLFTLAAAELGGDSSADPTQELLSYLETFKVLLILDNMETVLDQRLRDFLLDLPMGSKVMITSRIGLGIENPVQLAPLTADESANLLRAVSRVRQVPALTSLTQTQVQSLAGAMSGHPAYIKWFVSGVQAGRRPEELLSNNELLLDFCMSNVYEYLDESPKAVLRSMQSLPGAKTQAELAFVNQCNSSDIQAALLALITTNFVQMQSLSPSQVLETTYQLSDFGRQYLDKAHPVSPAEHAWLVARHGELSALGDTLRAENSASPFDPYTVDVRSTGDFHVAKLLRDAMQAVHGGDGEAALALCKEAQGLSPTYHEAWRVEALVHDLRGDFPSAALAYDRAVELAPDAAPLNYFYGIYLSTHGANPKQGLRRLQKAMQETGSDSAVLAQIARTHTLLADWSSAISTATHAARTGRLQPRETSEALLWGLRAAAVGAQTLAEAGAHAQSLELIEESLPVCAAVASDFPLGIAFDRILQLIEVCEGIAREASDDFVARKSAQFEGALDAIHLERGPHDSGRRIGRITTLFPEKYFGFIKCGKTDYFFHGRALPSADVWDVLVEGTPVAFRPIDDHPRGARAGEPVPLT